MKFGIVLLLSLVTTALQASAAAVADQETKSLLDDVITKLLEEKLRPVLENITISPINTQINGTGILLDLATGEISSEGLGNFTVVELATHLIPLRLDNLTLSWDSARLYGQYNLSGTVDIDALQGPVSVTGDGLAEIFLEDLVLTAAATITSSNGHFQIKELYDMNVGLARSKVTLENIFGGGEMEEIIDVFLSFFIPDFVNDSGKDILETLAPEIKDKINSILADSKTDV